MSRNVALRFGSVELVGELEFLPDQQALVAGCVFVKDYSEHTGLVAALAACGAVEPVGEVFVGPFRSRVAEVRIQV